MGGIIFFRRVWLEIAFEKSYHFCALMSAALGQSAGKLTNLSYFQMCEIDLWATAYLATNLRQILQQINYSFQQTLVAGLRSNMLKKPDKFSIKFYSAVDVETKYILNAIP